jgi:hypothetical protein
LEKLMIKTGKTLFVIFLMSLVASCNPLGKVKAKVTFFNPGSFQDLKLAVNSVSVQNNQLIITGSKLSTIKTATLKNNSQTETFEVESASDSQLITNGIKNISLLAGSVFDLVLSDAYGSATFQVSFTLANGSVTAAMLNNMNATAGQVLKYNGSVWAPASQIDTQAFIGTWDASNNIGGSPDLSVVSSIPGDYYVVTVAGTLNSVAYGIGDWIISDGYNWNKIPMSKTSVSSFQSRKGIVTLQPSDYVSLIDGTSHKVTGSALKDIADIDFTTAPTNGQTIKWNTATSKWLPADDLTGTSGIARTDLSATSPLSYNSTTGAFSLVSADLLALPLTNLTSGSGAIAAADSILGAFGKLMNTQGDYVSKASGAAAVTGTIAVTGTGRITVPTPIDGVDPVTEVTNVQYVTNAIAANGVWAKSGSTINYAAGNVGIGTTTPTAKLSIGPTSLSSGAITLTAANAATTFTTSSSTTLNVGDYLIPTTTTGQARSVTVGGTTTSFTVSPAFTAAVSGETYTVYPAAMNINNGKVLVQGSTGNVGIGTTAPTGILELLTPNGTSNIIFSRTGYANKFKVRVSTDGTNENMLIGPVVYDNALVVNALGNVGIGTTSPAASLHVNKTLSTGTISSTGTAVNGTGTNFTAAFSVGDQLVANGQSKTITAIANATNLTVNSVYSTDLVASTSYARVGAIFNAGNVGIGTTSPDNNFDISASVSGAVGGIAQITNPATSAVGNAVELRMAPSFAHTTRYASIQGINSDGNNNIDLAFLTGAGASITEKMRIKSDGKIGIGTTTPSQKLDVSGIVRAGSVSAVLGSTMLVDAYTNGSITNFGTEYSTGAPMIGYAVTPDTTSQASFLSSTPVASATRAAIEVGGATGIRFYQGGTQTVAIGSAVTMSEVMRITNSGNVGIGTTAPAAKLDVTDATTTTSAIIVPRAGNFTGTTANGMIRYNTTSNLFQFYQNGAWVNYTTVSDARLKTNIVPVVRGLDIVDKLNPVFYDWDKNNSRTESFGDKHQVGFIAQEVEKVLPEVVNKGADTYRSLEYGKIVSVVVAAVKELHKQFTGMYGDFKSLVARVMNLENKDLEKARAIASLEDKATKLEAENAQLKARLKKIEKILEKTK